jgi:CheY-like chemotaxis protein
VKVLIIEDYEGDIDLMLSRLKAIGCVAVVAKTADEGLRLAISEQPALILTDLNLGAGIEEGIEMVGSLRAHPATATIPLVIHSVFVSQEGELPVPAGEVSGILPKPYRFVDLTKLIARIRDAQAPEAGGTPS